MTKKTAKKTTVKSPAKRVAKKPAIAKPASRRVEKPVKALAKPLAKLAGKAVKGGKAGKSPARPLAAERSITARAFGGRVVTVQSQPSKPMLTPPPVVKAVAAKPVQIKMSRAQQGFATNDYVVYPTHGVGRIIGMERQEISGLQLDLFVVEFDKDKMTLRVPVSKVSSVGLRKLSTPQVMRSALDTLKGRARIKRTMWSRRAQEYEAKINSGDPVAIAEVVRDLHRNAGQPDQSYSERQIYEAALDRLARELAAVEQIDEAAATVRLEKVLRPAAQAAA